MTRDRDKTRARARARLGLGFKVVIMCRYALEKVLSVECINNLQN